MPCVKHTALSRVDLYQIWSYIADDNLTAADVLITKIDKRLQSLATMPTQGESVAFIRPGVRRVTVGNYVIYYHPIDDGIEVLRVLHGARQHENLF